jgi:hypothetical protein
VASILQLVSEFRRGDGNKLSAFVQFSKLALAIRHELIDLTENPVVLTQVFPVKGIHVCEGSSINSEDAYPSSHIDTAWEWTMAVRGPTDTPYEGGAFRFHVR